MNSSNEPPTFSAKATELVDQLHDIAHDDGDPAGAGIAWYLPVDEPPAAALEELVSSGLFRTTTRRVSGGEEIAVNFTEAGLAAYRATL